MSECDDTYRLLLIGDSGVGKTCLSTRFIKGTVTKEHDVTKGLNHDSKVVDIGGQSIKLQVWDSTGDERFLSSTQMYYRGAHGIMLVYDVNNMDSYERVIRMWMYMVKTHASTDVKLLLVGNKADEGVNKFVHTRTASEFAESNGVSFMESSARDWINVDDAFMKLAQGIFEAKNTKKK